MKYKVRLVINIVVAAVVIVAWLHMFFAGGGVLSHDGVSSLRFYTVLSNLLAGIAALIWIVAYARRIVTLKNSATGTGTHSETAETDTRSEAMETAGTDMSPEQAEAADAKAVRIKPIKWAEVLKYIASVSVFLTFTIVIAFLGPLYGHENMYQDTNLWFHLIIPVVAVIEMAFLSDYKIKRKDNRNAVLPTVLYGIVYVANNLINGIGEWPDTNDWYGFLLWGYPIGILIFICIGIVTWLLGRMIRFANNKRLKNRG